MVYLHNCAFAAPEPPIIRIERATKWFGTGAARRPALRDVTLHVKRGDIVGIVGKNGAGKSTLLRLINLLETPDCGTVVVAGRDLAGASGRDLRAARRHVGQHVGTLFQQTHLLRNLTVFDNVALPLRLHDMLNPPRLRRRVLDCLDLAGVAARADEYPARLSRDHAQRVALARALACQPQVLLCDEPASGLDPESARALHELLRAVHADLGVTLVIASHDLAALGTLCNRAAVLDDGVVAETFDPADTSAPRLTSLGRELAFHGSEGALPFLAGELHA